MVVSRLDAAPLLADRVPLAAVVVVLLTGFALAEVAVVHIPTGRSAYTLTLSEIPLVAGLFFLTPTEYVLVRVLGAAAPLAWRNRRSLRKLVFNLAWFTVEASLAVILWQLIAGSSGDLGPAAWLAAGVVAVVVDLLGTLLISLVM